ncbi:MAG: hypothetical protein ACLGRW_13595 [Acidobacteriota bacterium]
MRREMLNLTVDRDFVQRLLATGRAFDLERGGLFDARSGLINLWCGPHDKPACWNRPISRGGLSYPREYVGALCWEWQDDERVELYIEATPFSLLDRRRREPLPDQVWQELLAWLREKAMDLIRLARLEPRVVGTCCPFCGFILPSGALLNGLLEHIAASHPDVALHGLTLSEAPILATDRGEIILRSAERFE